MIAYVDESARETAGGIYVVASAVVVEDPSGTREAVLELLLPGQRRYHWHAEREERRHEMLDRMVELGVHVFGYVCRETGGGRRQERARARCLRRLLWDVGHHGVAELVIESRHPAADGRDRQTILRAQKAGEAPAELRYGFGKPEAEPLLWLPDAGAGAVASAAAGETDAYLRHLGSCAELVEVDP